MPAGLFKIAFLSSMQGPIGGGGGVVTGVGGVVAVDGGPVVVGVSVCYKISIAFCFVAYILLVVQCRYCFQ